MSPEDWEKVKQIFHEALEHPPTERAAFVAEASGANLAIRLEVESLLNCHEPAHDFIEDSPMQPPASDPIEMGQQLGKYKIVRLIGHGGMGVVYLADRDRVGGQVPIKVLSHALLSGARRERFTDEQRTLAGLNHPSIAQLHDFNLNDETPWFAMEYVDGVTITDYCKGRPIEECLRLFRSVCEAVRYAHGQMEVHCDLKPSNILVRSDGQNATVKLLDFGIARQLDASSNTGDSTLPALRLLTPEYAAPELFQGAGLYEADVYSLGVLLYKLLTGQLPIEK